jgi:hypothetical protein
VNCPECHLVGASQLKSSGIQLPVCSVFVPPSGTVSRYTC